MSEDDNTIDDVNEVMGDPYDNVTIEEILNIEGKDQNSFTMVFYKKYKPILLGHEPAFAFLVNITTELACNHSEFYTVYHDSNGHKVRIGSKGDFKKGLKNIEQIKKKIGKWPIELQISEVQEVIEKLDKLHQAFEERMEDGPKSRPRITYQKIASYIKDFWKKELRRKKFLYDDGNPCNEKATDFSNDFLKMFFDFNETTGLKEALRNITEPR